MVDVIVDDSGGLLTRGEIECWIDAVIASDLNPYQVAALEDDPLVIMDIPAGVETLGPCIDPSADVDVPMTDQFRADVVSGMVSEGATIEQANCLFDALVEAGFDVRDLTVAGLTGTGPDGFDAALTQAMGVCVAGGTN